jgi:hypothetical protein
MRVPRSVDAGMGTGFGVASGGAAPPPGRGGGGVPTLGAAWGTMRVPRSVDAGMGTGFGVASGGAAPPPGRGGGGVPTLGAAWGTCRAAPLSLGQGGAAGSRSWCTVNVAGDCTAGSPTGRRLGASFSGCIPTTIGGRTVESSACCRRGVAFRALSAGAEREAPCPPPARPSGL